MPTWKCPFFARKEINDYYWNTSLENCGLCINWCEDSCLHQEKLKDLGGNDLGKENIKDDNISVSYSFTNDGGSDGS